MNRMLILIAAHFLAVTIALAQWVEQPSPVAAGLFGIWFTSSSDGWIVGASGTLLRTTDGGGSWSAQSSPSAENLNRIAFIDSVRGYIVGDGNTILATADGGVSWRPVDDGNPGFANYYGLKISPDGSRAWVAGGWQTVGSSTVLGMTLGYTAPQLQANLGRCVGIDVLDAKTAWVCGMSSLILRTTDGGGSWSQPTDGVAGVGAGFNGIGFYDATVGLAVGDSGIIQRTTDGGLHWYNVRRQDEVLFSVQILSDSVAYVVGSLNRILVSTDRGESWQPQATPALPATTLQSVFFLNQSEGWIVGSGGTILHTTDGGLTAAEAGGRTQPKALLLKANYPNPFNPATTFEYELAEAGMVSLRVFDVTGREVALVFEGFQAPGRHLRVWNAGSCASGVYNVRLMVSDRNTARTAEQKVVLVR